MMTFTVPDTTQTLRLDEVIDGGDVPGERVLEVRNPGRRSEIVGTVVDGTSEHVEAAVNAAAAPQPKGGRRRPRRNASALLAASGTRSTRRRTDLIDPRRPGERQRPCDIRREVSGVRTTHSAKSADYLEEKLAAARRRSDSTGEYVRVERKPFGVVACIVPWNAPVMLTANKIAPAHGGRQRVVLKPSPFAPLGSPSRPRIAAASCRMAS